MIIDKAAKGLRGSYMVLKNIIDAFEFGLYPSVNILVNTTRKKKSLSKYFYSSFSNILLKQMDIIAYCDALTNVFENVEKLISN